MNKTGASRARVEGSRNYHHRLLDGLVRPVGILRSIIAHLTAMEVTVRSLSRATALPAEFDDELPHPVGAVRRSTLAVLVERHCGAADAYGSGGIPSSSRLERTRSHEDRWH